MTEERRARRKNRESTHPGDKPEARALRRIGAVLTLATVCVATIVIGYFVGRTVIQGVVHDTLGATPGSPVAQHSSAVANPSDGVPTGSLLPDPARAGDAPPNVATPTAALPTDSPTAHVRDTRAVDDAAVPLLTDSAEVPQAEQGNDPPPQALVQPAQSTGPTGQGSTASQSGPVSQPAGRVLHRIQVGGFADRPSAERLLERLQPQYPDAFIVPGPEFRVQVGAFGSKDGADEVVAELAAQGYDNVHVVKVEM